MDDQIVTALREHAAAESPRECCGMVLSVDGIQTYRACRNIATGSAEFEIHPEDWNVYQDSGEVLAICHSHVFRSPQPSQADLVGCEYSGLPWIIINHPTGIVHWFKPTGYQAPLLGRNFVHSIFDCYSLVVDHYARALQITLPDFHRDDEWWNKGGNLYLDHFDEAGFHQVPIKSMRENDMILMRIRSPVPNHAAIYLGGNVILQHLQNRLSSRDIYGGWYQKVTTNCLRHQRLL
jgi:proteasome lid subunit RPN8/RPN11